MPVTRRCFGQLFRLFCYCVLLALGTGEASSLTVMRKQTTLTDGADDVDGGDVTVTGHELVGEREDREQVHGRQEPSGDSEKLERRLPRALIIGVKKAGTRALLEFLRLHPDVRATGPETHFFDRHYNKGIEWYRLQMPLTLPGQITMEKTPSYFVTEEVPARIRSTLPEARLLVVVRDPVTRALSDYAQTASKRPDTTLPFEVLAFRRRRRRRDLDSTSTSRRRRNRSRNYISSGARRPIASGPSTDKTPAAFHYSMLEKAAKLFTGKLYGSEDSQLRHLTFRKDETYNKRDIEGREGTVSNRQPAHSEDRNYLPHRQVDNKMYTVLNVTKADDPLKRAQLENKGSWENYIPRGDTYIRIKNKGASSSSKGTDEDNKRVNEEDIEHTVSNGECGTVGHSANNSKCSNTSGDVDESWSGIRIGLYASHLAHWLSHFPQSQIHVVSGEELVRNPAREMAMVQDFLGLRRLVSEDHFYFNRTKGFPCLKKSEGSGSPHCLGKTKGRTHPRLSEESERRLREFFEPHNREFYKIVGRDFDWERAR